MIRKVFHGAFKGRKIISNATSIQASRLVSNCVIAYNAMILDKLYKRLCATVGEEKAKTILSKISPVACRRKKHGDLSHKGRGKKQAAIISSI